LIRPGRVVSRLSGHDRPVCARAVPPTPGFIRKAIADPLMRYNSACPLEAAHGQTGTMVTVHF